MSEFPHNHINGDDSPYTEHILAARIEAGHQHRRPPSGDRVIAEFSRQYPATLLAYDGLGKVLRIHWNREPLLLSPTASVGVPVSEKYGAHRMAFAYDAMFCQENGPPIYEYTNPAYFNQLFWNIRRDPDRLNMLRFNITNNVPTTDPKRYAPLEICTQMMRVATGEGFDEWEGGSSIPIGSRARKLKHDYPFTPQEIQKPFPVKALPWRMRDWDAIEAARKLLKRPSIEGVITATDLYPPGNVLHPRLLLAARRPQEIADTLGHKALVNLMEADVPTVRFREGDIMSTSIIRKVREEHKGSKIKAAFLGTMLNQVGQENIPSAIGNALDVLDEDGVLYILEFASVDPHDPSRLHLAPRWGNYTYGFFAVHKNDDKRAIHELMRFKNSRMEGMQLSNGRLDLGDGRGLQPFRQQLLYCANRA